MAEVLEATTQKALHLYCLREPLSAAFSILIFAFYFLLYVYAMESRNKNWEEYVRFKISKNKFGPHIGLEFTDLKPGYVKAHLPFQPIHEQQNGFLHGGVTSAILDMVCGFAAYTLVEQEQQVYTVETKCVYYNRGMGKEFFAEGRVDKAGKRFHFCEGEIYYFDNDKKVTVAKCTTTMAVV